MTVAKYTNVGVSALFADVAIADTTLVLENLSDVTKFPSIAESWDFFRIALTDIDGNYEIMKVTAIAGSTFTVERAQEGTIAKDWVAGDKVRENGTAELLDEIRNEGAGGEVIEKSADFTLTPAEANKTIQTSGGITITISPLVKFKSFSRLMIKNNSGNQVTISPDGIETIDGNANYILPAKYSVEIYKGTTGWEIKTLSATKVETSKKMYMQGLLLNPTDVDTVVVEAGICSDSTGAIDLVVTTPLQADTNLPIGTGAGGMPATVVKSGTFSSVGTAVVGTGSLFTTEFKKGDVLWSPSNDEGQVVVAVLTDTQMVVQLAFDSDVASDAVMKNGLAVFAWYFPIIAYNPTTDTMKLVLDTQKNAENALADAGMTGFTVFRHRGFIGTDALKEVISYKWKLESSGALKISPSSEQLLVSGQSSAAYESISCFSPNNITVSGSFMLNHTGHNQNNQAKIMTSDSFDETFFECGHSFSYGEENIKNHFDLDIVNGAVMLARIAGHGVNLYQRSIVYANLD